ncbi:MAG: hypothetical protein HWD85_06805 [Flavobacteriaceae bacterium]|nr:hypothetical protein [Flavobacteriaceae bacterium]
MYKVRAILDTPEDVIRTIVVNNKITLEELHLEIAKSFDFDGQEMASFYRTDNDWNQGEEIPLFNMSEFENALSMRTCVLEDTLANKNDKLIYVYDFFSMWSFYIEVIDITDEIIEAPKLIMSIGKMPEKAPDKEFIADDFSDDLPDDSLDIFDDFDFDNY